MFREECTLESIYVFCRQCKVASQSAIVYARNHLIPSSPLSLSLYYFFFLGGTKPRESIAGLESMKTERGITVMAEVKSWNEPKIKQKNGKMSTNVLFVCGGY